MAHRTSENTTNNKEKVIICLHGVSGTSQDTYLTELTNHVIKKGYNMVVFNHYAPKDETELRLMDMNHNRYLDEVIEFTKSKFDKEGEECEIYVVGFSLGGNHSLRYAGTSNMLKQKGD